MKIFKWWQSLIVLFAVLVIGILFFLVAFNVEDGTIPRWSLFAAMFFGLGSICLSLLALWISIQTFITSNREKKIKLEKEANDFIIANSDEIQYIPLCVMANSFNRHCKYSRKIYESFNRLNNDQQKEVLKQLNYDCDMIKDTNWIDDGLERVRLFINEYQLGADLLYDNAKYYKRVFDYKEEKYIFSLEHNPFISSLLLGLPKYEIRNNEPIDKGITFDEYLHRYLYAFISKDARVGLLPKPIDLLIEGTNWREADEDFACFWVMVIVDCCSRTLMEKYNREQKVVLFPFCEGTIETYEDRFLMSLSNLYNLSKYRTPKA